MNPTKARGGRRDSSAPLYLFLTLATIAALLVAGGTARADHPAGNDSVSPILDNKSPALEGITVQIQDTQGAQVVLENETQKRLEVYDAEGEPFLRIGPNGVEANRSAEAFYETYGPRGVNAPEGTGDEQAADWQKISDQSSWGWFDRRLRTDDVEVPGRILHSENAASFGGWEVPVSLGGEEAELRGSYRYKPEPSGAYLPALTSEPQRAGIEVQISQGYGGPSALLLQNSGEKPVTVLDAEGNPALRIGPKEVRANMKSPVGRQASRSAGSAGTTSEEAESAEGAAGSGWQTVSSGSSFTWQDPRLRPPSGQAQPPVSNVGERQEVAQWEIPLEISGKRYTMEGVITWRPLEDAGSDGESEHDHASHDHSPDQTSATEQPEPGHSNLASRVSAAAIVPAAGLFVAATAGGTLLYRRWRASQ